MKAERLPSDRPDLGVELLDSGVGEVVLDGGEDPVALVVIVRASLTNDGRRQRLTQASRRSGKSLGGSGGELVDLA